MTWGKTSDDLHSHPKAERAGLTAMGLWTLAMSHAADLLTDGYVTRERVGKLCGSSATGLKLAARLTASGLWHGADEPCPRLHMHCDAYRVADPHGFRFHDWEDYQPTRAEVEAERARKAEAGRRGGLAKARAVAGATAVATAPAIAPASPVLPEAALLPIPSRPVPSPSPEIQIPPGGGADAPTKAKRERKPRGPGAEPSGYRPTVDAYFAAFEFARGMKPAFGAREGKAVKTLLEALGGDAVRAIVAIKASLAPGAWPPNATILDVAKDPSRYLGTNGGSHRKGIQPAAPPGQEAWTPATGEEFWTDFDEPPDEDPCPTE